MSDIAFGCQYEDYKMRAEKAEARVKELEAELAEAWEACEQMEILKDEMLAERNRLQEEVDHLRKENKQWVDNAVDKYALVKPLREVLEWYAKNCDGMEIGPIPLCEDQGERARNALAGQGERET